MKPVDLSRSLQELEGDDWGEPTYPSYVVTTCHTMRRKPLRDVTTEELRLVIGQGFSLDYLMPMAIAKLEENPLADGDFYEGDLLKNVLTVPASFWDEHPAWREAVDQVARRSFVLCAALEGGGEFNLKILREAYSIFCGSRRA